MMAVEEMTLAPMFEAMPAELRQLPRWVTWKRSGGRKVPCRATAINSPASSTNPDTWASFDQAQTAYEEGGYAGVGFVLNGDGLVGVDLDSCVTDGTPTPAALGLLNRIGCSYVEYSPSGTGLRAFGYGPSLDNSRKRGTLDGVNVELYSTTRYLTVTGHTLARGPLRHLPGFAAAAAELGSPTEEVQRNTEDDLSHPLSSSVGVPANTIPTGDGQRNACLFKLARYVKAQNPSATRAELRAIAEQWHTLALPYIATKDFGVTLMDFLRGFGKVRHPFGSTMQTIIESTDTTPLPDGIEALGYGEQGQHLVRLCVALQAHHDPEPFFLSARQAGEAIGVHFTDASKMLSTLVFDGVLELVKRGAGNVASRYRLAWGSEITSTEN